MSLLTTNKLHIRRIDLDVYNHVNHAVLIHFLTEARIELCRELLTSDKECQFVMTELTCKYKASYHYPDVLILKQYCQEMGKTNFVLRYEFFSESKPDVLHAEATTTMVAYNPVAKKIIRIPEKMVALLKKEATWE